MDNNQGTHNPLSQWFCNSSGPFMWIIHPNGFYSNLSHKTKHLAKTNLQQCCPKRDKPHAQHWNIGCCRHFVSQSFKYSSKREFPDNRETFPVLLHFPGGTISLLIVIFLNSRLISFHSLIRLSPINRDIAHVLSWMSLQGINATQSGQPLNGISGILS